jgi:hypothetical protein
MRTALASLRLTTDSTLNDESEASPCKIATMWDMNHRRDGRLGIYIKPAMFNKDKPSTRLHQYHHLYHHCL